VYSTVRLAHFRELVAGLTLSFNDVEKLIVRCVKNRQLAVRVDHRNGARGAAAGAAALRHLCLTPAPPPRPPAGCLYLGNESLETTETRRQLTLLATRLQSLVTAILPADAPAAAGRAGIREAVCALARGAQGKGVHDAASRRKIIERRKEDEERLKQQRDREVREGVGEAKGREGERRGRARCSSDAWASHRATLPIHITLPQRTGLRV